MSLFNNRSKRSKFAVLKVSQKRGAIAAIADSAFNRCRKEPVSDETYDRIRKLNNRLVMENTKLKHSITILQRELQKKFIEEGQRNDNNRILPGIMQNVLTEFIDEERIAMKNFIDSRCNNIVEFVKSICYEVYHELNDENNNSRKSWLKNEDELESMRCNKLERNKQYFHVNSELSTIVETRNSANNTNQNINANTNSIIREPLGTLDNKTPTRVSMSSDGNLPTFNNSKFRSSILVQQTDVDITEPMKNRECLNVRETDVFKILTNISSIEHKTTSVEKEKISSQENEAYNEDISIELGRKDSIAKMMDEDSDRLKEDNTLMYLEPSPTVVFKLRDRSSKEQSSPKIIKSSVKKKKDTEKTEKDKKIRRTKKGSKIAVNDKSSDSSSTLTVNKKPKRTWKKVNTKDQSTTKNASESIGVPINETSTSSVGRVLRPRIKKVEITSEEKTHFVTKTKSRRTKKRDSFTELLNASKMKNPML